MSPAPAPPELQLVDSVVLAATGSTVAREYSIADLPRIAEAENAAAATFDHTIRVCVAAGCLSLHSDQVQKNLEHEVQERGLKHCRVKGVCKLRVEWES